MAPERIVTIDELGELLISNGGKLRFGSTPPEGFVKYPEGLTPDLEKDTIYRVAMDYKEFASCVVHHSTGRVFDLRIRSRSTFEDPLLYLRVTNKLRGLLSQNDIPFIDERDEKMLTETRQYITDLEVEAQNLENQLRR